MSSPAPEPDSAPDSAAAPSAGAAALLRLQEVGTRLQQQFLAKEEIIRLLLIAVLAGEHLLLIGPPGSLPQQEWKERKVHPSFPTGC